MRRIEIGAINALVILWLLKVVLYDKSSDVVGVFTLLTITFLLFYNGYFVVLNRLFFKSEAKNLLLEAAFFLLLLIPIFLLWYFTS